MSQNIEQALEHSVESPTSSSSSIQLIWESDINWKRAENYVRRMQERIYYHTTRQQWSKVKNLQKLLAKSYYAKVLAIREVTQRNRGKNTPGIDNKLYDTPTERWQLSKEQFNYQKDKPLPLKRVFIPKQDGSQRPLGIPTIHDRVMQMIVKFALEPEYEAKFEPNSYGFRPGRSTMDAMDQIRKHLGATNGRQWVLDADISKCFDSISHDYLISQIPTFAQIIRRWLKVGVIEFGIFSETDSGTPQGGIISPLLANIALHGMETHFQGQKNISLVRYADHFVVIANSKEILEQEVLPKLTKFIEARGLHFNNTKTKIIHRTEGFTFLGFAIKYYEKTKIFASILLITPPKTNISKMLQTLTTTFRKCLQKPLKEVIVNTNWIIRGWAYYYRFSNAKKSFNYVQYRIFLIVWRILRRRHADKGSKWLKNTYFKKVNAAQWTLFEDDFILFNPVSIPIKKYIKVNEFYSPFNRLQKSYWKQRQTINA